MNTPTQTVPVTETSGERVSSPGGGRASGVSVLLMAAVVLVLVALSLVPRLYNLRSPLLERHEFRQTQTAISVREMLSEGISLLHYKTPVFGPPWEVPFEFPIYQATVAVVVKVTGADLDLACRATHLGYFYLSAAVLFALVSRLVGREAGAASGRWAAVCVLGVYLLSPFTVLWSRSAMIEYAAVLFGLGYVYALVRWCEQAAGSRGAWGWLSAAIVSGCLAALTKITTVAGFVPLMAAYGVWSLVRDTRTPAAGGGVAQLFLARIAAMVSMAAVPLAVGAAWVWHTDRIKAAAFMTRWLTSDRLSSWNHGTWAQRQNPANWLMIVERLWEVMLPYGVVMLPVLFLASPRLRGRTALLFVGGLAGVIFPIAVFFNLYVVHDYYLCAVSPMAAIVAGLGLYGLVSAVRAASPTAASFAVRGTALATVAGVIFAVSWWMAFPYLRIAYTTRYDDHPTVILGRAIDKVTPPGNFVIVTDNKWSPDILYYARRRGCMIIDLPSFEAARIPLDRITTVVTKDPNHPVLAKFGWKGQYGRTGDFRIMLVSMPKTPTSGG